MEEAAVVLLMLFCAGPKTMFGRPLLGLIQAGPHPAPRGFPAAGCSCCREIVRPQHYCRQAARNSSRSIRSMPPRSRSSRPRRCRHSCRRNYCLHCSASPRCHRCRPSWSAGRVPSRLLEFSAKMAYCTGVNCWRGVSGVKLLTPLVRHANLQPVGRPGKHAGAEINHRGEQPVGHTDRIVRDGSGDGHTAGIGVEQRESQGRRCRWPGCHCSVAGLDK